MMKRQISKMILAITFIIILFSMITSASATCDNYICIEENQAIADMDYALNEGDDNNNLNDHENNIEENNVGDTDNTNNPNTNLKNRLDASSSIYVSPEGVDEEGYGTKENPYKTLQYSINKSSENSIIYLNSGNYIGEKNRNLLITKSITIIGNKKENTIIDAESISRIFIVNSSDIKLTLFGLTLTNAYIDGEDECGGAIYNNYGEINLINSTISYSYGGMYGGAIYNNLGSLKVINSTIINNSAFKYGGAIYTLGKNYFENVNFTKNTLTSELGVGACVALGGSGTFKKCNFYKNHANYSAAGILNLGNITIDNCTFINLTTNYTAGGISNHNYAFINNSYFKSCDVKYYAAAILAPPSGQHVITEVHNTIFETNHAGNHGAVTNNYKDTEIIFDKCALVGNYIMKNYFYGDISLDDNASALYCWWGQNEISPYYYSPHSNNEEPGTINASRWLVMTFKSSNGVIYQDEDNLLTVDLKHYFDNETKEIYEFNESLNLPLSVKFYTEDGQIIRTAKLVNGTVQIKYNPKTNVEAVYAKLNNQTLRIEVKTKEESSIIAKDLVKIYNNGSSLEVKLVDKDNNPIPNKNIAITIAGKTYTKVTDENGVATLSIKLTVRTVDAKIELKNDTQYKNCEKTIKITVLKDKTEIAAKNLVKYYRNSSQLSVKLVDGNNKAISNKQVIICIAGKEYKKTTDANGAAKLTINLIPKTYNATIKFKGDNNYNASSASIKITVLKPKMKALKTTLKNKKEHFTVNFKDAYGQIIKNTKVKFALNKKEYIRTTDNNGNAKILINLEVGNYYTVKTSFESYKTYGTMVLSTKIKVI